MSEPPYQPTLLSFEDMLNLDNQDDWGGGGGYNNQYNLSNFFDSLLTSPPKETKSSDQAPASNETVAVPTTTDVPVFTSDPLATLTDPIPSSSSGGFSNYEEDQEYVLNPFFSPVKQPPPESLKKGSAAMAPTSATRALFFSSEPVSKPEPYFENDAVDDVLQIFDEALVKELGASEESSPLEVIEISLGENGIGIKEDEEMQMQQHEVLEELPSVSGIPTLKEVLVDDDHVEEANEKPSQDFKESVNDILSRVGSKQVAIDQLDAIITSLKRYSKLLGNFLEEEGDVVLERYNITQLGILKEKKSNPLEFPRSITRALVNGMKGRTALSTLPPRYPYLWRSSELLALQKAVLESAIARQEFLLSCRYTQLLTDMGFDSEDLSRLSRCPTKQSELGLMKLLISDHKFFSSLPGKSGKDPIQRLVLKEQHGTKGIPRVFSYPSPEELIEEKWRLLRNIQRKTTSSSLQDKDIDWLFVMKRLSVECPQLKASEDICRLAYSTFLSPKLNMSPWHIEELRKLRDLRQKYSKMPWSYIADLMETGRSPFSCFVKFKAHCIYATKQTSWSIASECYKLIPKYLEECGGNTAKVEKKLYENLPKSRYSQWMAPRNIPVVCRKAFNPRRRRGKFSLVEDTILLVVLEKYSEYFLECNGYIHADPVGYAMPWRYSYFWRVRFAKLLTNFFTANWTLDDDKLLLTLIEEHGPNYKIIQRSFPLRDRKQCRNRYMRIHAILEKYSLEDYHALYSCERKGVRLHRLNEIVEYLEVTIKAKRAGGKRIVRQQDLEFLRRRDGPSDSTLETYLLSFPLEVMEKAMMRLVDCLLRILEKVEEFRRTQEVKTEERKALKEVFGNVQLGEEMKGFNRRIFDRECPRSVASALHMRYARLIPQEILEKSRITPFEREVYKYHKYFNLKGRMKLKARRVSIPNLDELRAIPTISRMLEPKCAENRVVTKISTNDPGEDESLQPRLVVPLPRIRKGLEVKKQEEDILLELEERKKGGRRKGAKRKKTTIREQKRLAALTRWQKRIPPMENIPEEEESEKEGQSPWNSDFDSYPVTPATPSTPGSSFNNCAESETENASISISSRSGVSSSGYSMRNAVLGVLSDHQYFGPMVRPSAAALSNLTIPHLFAKINYVHVKQERFDLPQED